jgi:hypothetical protein
MQGEKETTAAHMIIHLLRAAGIPPGQVEAIQGNSIEPANGNAAQTTTTDSATTR